MTPIFDIRKGKLMSKNQKSSLAIIFALGCLIDSPLGANEGVPSSHPDIRRSFDSAHLVIRHLRQDGPTVSAGRMVDLVRRTDGSLFSSAEFGSKSARGDRAYSIFVRFMGTLDGRSKTVPATGADVYAISVVDYYDGRDHTNHLAVVYLGQDIEVYAGPYLNVVIGPDAKSINEKQLSWCSREILQRLSHQKENDKNAAVPYPATLEALGDGMVLLTANDTTLLGVIHLLQASGAEIVFDASDNRFLQKVTINVENSSWLEILTGLLEEHGMTIKRDEVKGEYRISAPLGPTLDN